MNTCVIVINLKDELNIEKFVEYAHSNLVGCELVVASKSLHNNPNIKEYIFDNDNPDAVLNTLIKKFDTNRLVIVRQFDNSNFSPIKSVCENLTKDNQICILRKKHNKFLELFQKFFQKVVSFVFGYNYFEGSVSCVGFGKMVISVLKQFDNSSTYTKVDKWSGVDIKTIQASKVPKVKFKINILKNLMMIFGFTLGFVGLLLTWIFVKYIQKSIPLRLLFVFVMAICLCFVVLNTLIIFTKHKIGENVYDIANIIGANSQND